MHRPFYNRSLLSAALPPEASIPLPMLSPSSGGNFQLHFPQLEIRSNQFPVVGISPSSSYSSTLSSVLSESSSESSSTSSSRTSSTSCSPSVFKSTPKMFKCILGDLSRLYDGTSALKTDFTIITTKSLSPNGFLESRLQRHQAHRFVLSFRSRYFESFFRFESNQEGKPMPDELVLNDITGEVMAAILHYIYMGTFAYEPVDQLMELMVAADHFLLDELVRALTDTILADLAPDKVVHIFKVASKHFNFARLTRTATTYILDHGYLMLEEPSFLQLNTVELVSFLANDRFCVVEDDLVPFLRKYIKEHAIDEQEDRVEVMSKLLSVVRFAMLVDGPKLLATLDATDELFFDLVVAKYDQAEVEAEEIERRQMEKKVETEKKSMAALSLSSFLRPESLSLSSSTNSSLSVNLVKGGTGKTVPDELPFRNCTRFPSVTIHAPQLDSEVLLRNGNSIFAVRAPISLKLTFDRKIVVNRMRYYVRCANSVNVWFEYTEEDVPFLAEADDDDVVVEYDDLFPVTAAGVCYRLSKDGTKWFELKEASTYGSNRTFECTLSKPIFARHMRINLKPVTSDLTFFPVSVINLAFTLKFPREALLGGSELVEKESFDDVNEPGDLENAGDNGGEEEEEENAVFAY